MNENNSIDDLIIKRIKNNGEILEHYISIDNIFSENRDIIQHELHALDNTIKLLCIKIHNIYQEVISNCAYIATIDANKQKIFNKLQYTFSKANQLFDNKQFTHVYSVYIKCLRQIVALNTNATVIGDPSNCDLNKLIINSNDIAIHTNSIYRFLNS